MNTIMSLLNRTLQGMEQCFANDKTIVLLLATLLILWLQEKNAVDRKGNRFLVYTLVMAVVLLCPLTAMLVVIYQTAFYDYEWAWSMVPMLAVIAYAAVVLYEGIPTTFAKWKKRLTVILVLAALVVCFGGGKLLTVDAKETEARSQTKEVVECLEQNSDMAQMILWAPRKIMQEVRRQTGEILLIYGKDMWDEKSGAYDYEAYDESVIAAYEWMELVTLLAEESESAEMFDDLFAEYELDAEAQKHICTMLHAGINVLALPNAATDYFEADVYEFAEEYDLTIEKVCTQQYALYLLK